jgi:hypothetical protein
MDHGTVDACRIHLGQRILVRVRRILSVMGDHPTVVPDMDL